MERHQLIPMAEDHLKGRHAIERAIDDETKQLNAGPVPSAKAILPTELAVDRWCPNLDADPMTVSGLVDDHIPCRVTSVQDIVPVNGSVFAFNCIQDSGAML